MLIKTQKEIEIMKKAGAILAGIISEVSNAAMEGVALIELDKLAEARIKESGCRPAFLGYRPEGAKRAYPSTICASLNDGIVHGIPDNRVLKDEDILKLDFGLLYPPENGLYVDSAITKIIGNTNDINKKLVQATKEALIKGIEKMIPGNHLGDISEAIQKHVEENGFSIVEGLTGHGIGRKLHEEPSIFNVGKSGNGMKLQDGMVFALEPMASIRSGAVVQKKDDSFVTKDGGIAAHWEHTIAITNDGPLVLTKI